MNDLDPVIMYIIVRESLNMSIGKTAAQCAHVARTLQFKFDSLPSIKSFEVVGEGEDTRLTFQSWINDPQRRIIVKRADDKEFAKLKELKQYHFVAIDAGLTEVDPNTETAIGFWPMLKSNTPPVIKKLQLLK